MFSFYFLKENLFRGALNKQFEYKAARLEQKTSASAPAKLFREGFMEPVGRFNFFIFKEKFYTTAAPLASSKTKFCSSVGILCFVIPARAPADGGGGLRQEAPLQVFHQTSAAIRRNGINGRFGRQVRPPAAKVCRGGLQVPSLGIPQQNHLRK